MKRYELQYNSETFGGWVRSVESERLRTLAEKIHYIKGTSDKKSFRIVKIDTEVIYPKPKRKEKK